MCKTQGNRDRTMCVAAEETEKKQLKGQATCGCCEDASGNTECPTACSASNSMACEKEDDTGGIVPGFFMCMTRQGGNPNKQGQGGYPNKQRQGDRKRIMCVAEEETEKKQLKGQAECGCCGDCPTACNANPCTKEDDTEGGVNGFYMCMKQGNRERIMCVGAEETEKRQKNGLSVAAVVTTPRKAALLAVLAQVRAMQSLKMAALIQVEK